MIMYPFYETFYDFCNFFYYRAQSYKLFSNFAVENYIKIVKNRG
jgi:hypothetical protein